MINIDVYLLSDFTKWYFSTPISLNLACTEFYLYIMSGTKFDTTTFWNTLIYLTGEMQIFCSKDRQNDLYKFMYLCRFLGETLHLHNYHSNSFWHIFSFTD